LRIRTPAKSHAPILAKILVYASDLVAESVAICNDLTAGAERLAREGWTWMTLFFNGLVELSPPGAIPTEAVVEELPKLLD
jgi:hypothetical protein